MFMILIFLKAVTVTWVCGERQTLKKNFSLNKELF